jgi:Holliday junction resolvasome RuvABC endonuclease subunit
MEITSSMVDDKSSHSINLQKRTKIMRILALDCALKTGWASFCNRIIESGIQDFNLKRGESKGMVFLRFRNWLNGMIGLINPNLIIYEQAHHRGGWATQISVGLITRIMELCDEKGIEYSSIHSMSLKKFATGTGKASKEDMLRAAIQKFGRIVDSYDEADALLLLAYAMKEFEEAK